MIDCTKTEQYFAEKQRMVKLQTGEVCEISCEECPLSSINNGEGIVCSDFETCYPEKAIAIVQKWSDEHPPKTFLTEFLKPYKTIELKYETEEDYNKFKKILELNKLRKPILVDEQVIGNIFLHRYIYKCPNCGRQFRNNGSLNYCYNCGQRLDWSDEMDGEK